jgi:hypothetical protein
VSHRRIEAEARVLAGAGDESAGNQCDEYRKKAEKAKIIGYTCWSSSHEVAYRDHYATRIFLLIGGFDTQEKNTRPTQPPSRIALGG